MAVTVLDALTTTTDNNTSPQGDPSAGTDRYWIMAVMRDGSVTGGATATLTGTADTTFDLICYQNGVAANVQCAIYGCKDADFGSGASTSNGGLAGMATSSTDCRVWSIVLQGVDQTTPFTNVADEGYSVNEDGSSQTLALTLDEIVDGLGICFAGTDRSTTVTSWTVDNSYTDFSGSPNETDVNWSNMYVSKAISGESLGAVTTFDCGSASRDMGAAGVMILPAGGGGSTPTDVNYSASNRGIMRGVARKIG